jgi:hypothetical protein
LISNRYQDRLEFGCSAPISRFGSTSQGGDCAREPAQAVVRHSGIVMSELKLRPPKRHALPTSSAVGARHVADPPQEGRAPTAERHVRRYFLAWAKLSATCESGLSPPFLESVSLLGPLSSFDPSPFPTWHDDRRKRKRTGLWSFFWVGGSSQGLADSNGEPSLIRPEDRPFEKAQRIWHPESQWLCLPAALCVRAHKIIHHQQPSTGYYSEM